MKKIILLAIMLGLVGCGENGSSDVASPTNNQSTELTSNNIQQASARSISTYSMTVPFDGWHLFNPKALGASALYEGTKDALTSSAVLTADASQVAKVLGKGVAGYALSVAVEELLGAVDWVMDPANNRIKYTVKPLDPKDPTVQYYYSTGSKMSNGQSAFGLTALQACENLIAGTTRLAGKIANAEEIAKSNDRYCFYDQTSMLGNIYRNKNPAYDPSLKKEEYLLLETVAQKVIENADAGSLDAQVATMAAAAQKLADAANDEEIEQEIVDDLEANANNCNPSKDENCLPGCNPPAGVKFNKITHYERHGRNPDPNAGSHGCMEKTGSPVHWHYSVNHQLPDGSCRLQRHADGGCGEAPND